MSAVSGELLRQYRQATGLTQDDLGNRIGVARQTIAAWERSVSTPSLEQLFALARHFAVPVDLLLVRSSGQVSGQTILFRADHRDELTAETLALLSRRAEDYAAVERSLGEVPSLPESWPADQHDPELIERVSRSIRDCLGVSEGPLRDVIGLLESRGLKVICHPLPAKVSGFSAYSQECGAIIFVNSNHPIERQYFTTLHELAHLVLHRADYSRPAQQVKGRDPREESANLLAGMLLLPREITLAELRAYRARWIPEPLLLDIKLRYWVSMRTVLYRAQQVGLISLAQMGRQMGALKRAYGTESEPGTVPGCQGMPRLTRLVYAALLAERITASRAAEVLAVPLLEVQENLAEWLKGGSD